jgi:hypothetical protein
MKSLSIILTEIEKLPAADLRRLLHMLVDKILATEKNAPQPNGAEPSFRKFRGVAKGFWGQDAQNYINQLRSDERF